MESKLYTIYLLVGPSGCGKTTFTKELIEQINLKYDLENVQYISSDNLRREVLGKQLDKTNPLMMQGSQGAFDLLKTKLEAVTAFPINSELVFVDTTGLSSQFREEVIQIAKRNWYNVEYIVFDYKGRSEYIDHLEGKEKQIASKHWRRFKERVLRELRLNKTVTKKHIIKSKDYSVDFTLTDYDEYSKSKIEGDYIVVGDLHGCIKEFRQVLVETGVNPNNEDIIPIGDVKVILLGDLVDKGNGVKETLSFVRNNLHMIKVVLGNHDSWCWRYHQGEFKNVTKDVLALFDFASYGDEEDWDNLEAIYTSSTPFLRHQNFTCTHSPCSPKYLWKFDSLSRKRQINTKQPRESEEDLYDFFERIRNHNLVYHTHIWGHVALENVFKHYGNYGIDTGCVHGNKLSYLDTRTWRYDSISALNNRDEPVIKKTRPEYWETIDLDNLDSKVSSKLKRLKNINFISGTMSPSPTDRRELEPLSTALDYYRGKTENVVLQPKFMGSRANIYLFEDPEKCYTVSRSGYRIWDRKENCYLDYKLQDEYKRLISLFREDFDNGLTMRLIDAELLPWSFLGEGLINKNFYGYYDLAKKEFENFLENDFVGKVINPLRELFSEGFDEKTKKEIIEEHGHHIWSTYLGYKGLQGRDFSPQTHLELLERFKNQVDLYGQDSEPTFKPFAILKDVWGNSEEVYIGKSNYEMFVKLNNYVPMFVNLDNVNSLRIAQRYFDSLSIGGFEGVVVKPEFVSKDILPYIKVRNSEYLRIVYGHDYTNFTDKLIARKNVTYKMKKSLRDWQRGLIMLEIPYSQVGSEKMQRLIVDHIDDEKKNSNIDPRL